MGEWTDLAVAFVLIGGFCIGVCWLSFLQGVKVGKAAVPTPPAMPKPPQAKAQTIGDPLRAPCIKCGQRIGIGEVHHPACPMQPKERRTGKPWVGFSRAKRDLESQESINATE